MKIVGNNYTGRNDVDSPDSYRDRDGFSFSIGTD